MKKRIAVAVCIFSLYSANVLAQTATTSMAVSVTIGNPCSITANNLTFSKFNPLKPVNPSNGQAQSNLYITCLVGIDYNIFLSAGNSADFTSRYMLGSTSNSSKLRYNLYTDASFTNIWGDQTQSYLSGVGSGLSQDFIVYGQIAGGQATTVRPDSYFDTIQVNISY